MHAPPSRRVTGRIGEFANPAAFLIWILSQFFGKLHSGRKLIFLLKPTPEGNVPKVIMIIGVLHVI